MQDQAPLGPESGMAIPAEDGGVDLYVATQWLHVDREQIAPCLNLPLEKVRLHLAGVGGAFGAREDVSMQIHACMLALRTGRPVKMSYTREESFYGHVHRHPAHVWMRHGARRDGTLVYVYARLVLDGGAYASSSAAVIHNAATFPAGPYEGPNALIEATCVYTNNPPCGAMRRFGAVQAAIGYEAQMDKLAKALGMPPIQLRLKNVVSPGSVLPTGQVIRGSAPVRELIRRCAAIPLPPEEPAERRDPLSLPGGAGNVSRGERLKRGVGFAVGYKNIAYSGGVGDSAGARGRPFPGPGGAPARGRVRRLGGGGGPPLPRSGRRHRRSPQCRRRSRAGHSHGPGADRADGVGHRACPAPPPGHDCRLRRVDLSGAADDDVGRRRAAGLSGCEERPLRPRPPLGPGRGSDGAGAADRRRRGGGGRGRATGAHPGGSRGSPRADARR